MAETASGGFTVAADVLAAGSGQVTGLQQRCEQVATAVIETIAQMAGAAGHPGVGAALVAASQTGAERFLDAGALYAHTAQGLRQSADGFHQADHTAAADARAVMRGPR